MDNPQKEKTEKSSLLSSGIKPEKKYRLVTVEPALILYTIYFGGSIPLLQQYVYKKTGESRILNSSVAVANSTIPCSDLTNDALENGEAFLIEQEIQRISSLWLVSFTAVLLVPSLVSSLMFGSYSDMVGRKVALIASVLGGAAKCVMATIVIWQDLALPYIYIGVALEGLTGGATTFYTASFAYMSDITTIEQRALRIIILQFCLALGILITEITVGYLIAAVGYMWPFLIIVAVLFINIIYIVCFLPQAMPRNANPKAAKFFTFSNFKKSFNLYITDTAARRRWKLHICLALIFFFGMCELGRVDVSILFALRSPLCFTSVMIGYFAAAAFVLPGIGSVILTKLCQPRMKETGLILLGCVSAAASCVLFAFSTKPYMIYLTCLVGFFGKLPVGMLRSYSSKVVEPDEAGALFASFAWTEGVATIVGGLAFTGIYNATLYWFQGFVFLVIALIYCASFFPTLFLRLREKHLVQQGLDGKWPGAISSSGDENEIVTH